MASESVTVGSRPSGTRATVLRITEEAEEDPGLLSYLEARALTPGAHITILARSESLDSLTALARPVAFDQDVAGLDVTVHEAVTMRFVERAGDLRDDGHRVPGVETAPLGQQGAQIGALDAAHRHVEAFALLPGVVDRHHVRMLERGGDPALALEAGAEIGVPGDARRDQLERDPAV